MALQRPHLTGDKLWTKLSIVLVPLFPDLNRTRGVIENLRFYKIHIPKLIVTVVYHEGPPWGLFRPRIHFGLQNRSLFGRSPSLDQFVTRWRSHPPSPTTVLSQSTVVSTVFYWVFRSTYTHILKHTQSLSLFFLRMKFAVRRTQRAPT